jgi:hypothetical protein
MQEREHSTMMAVDPKGSWFRKSGRWSTEAGSHAIVDFEELKCGQSRQRSMDGKLKLC